jgi:hypothetical protein
MPKCPRSDCNIEWVWDWESDTYCRKDTGVGCEVREVYKSHEDKNYYERDFIELTAYICSCGKPLGILVHDWDGAGPYIPPEWRDVDWELKENSWRPSNPKGIKMRMERKDAMIFTKIQAQTLSTSEANVHGHTLGKWKEGFGVLYRKCKDCKAWIQIQLAKDGWEWCGGNRYNKPCPGGK